MNKLLRSPLYNLLIGVITLMTTSIVCNGQTKTGQLENLINKYYEYGKFNGSVLVAHEGKVVYKKGFGLANMEWDIPNMPDTKHRLGSITKQFTAMLILQLASESKLDLHKPITTYLPDYPKEKGDRITTHHLLTHSSGIPNYTEFPNFFSELSRDPFTPEEFVETFAAKDLEFPPGDDFSYSNSGYFLLGVLIEKITGKTYEEMLHENIFEPLGMDDSGYDNHEDILKNRAAGYEKIGQDYTNAYYLDMTLPFAAGSMYSTVEDLYLWDQALYTDKLLPQEYMDLLFAPHIPIGGSSHYAYGWGVGNGKIGNTQDSLTVISHGGGINGFATSITRSPDEKSLIVLLNNTGDAPLGRMTRAIRGIMYGSTYELPKKSLAYELLNVIQKKGIEAGTSYFITHKNSDELDVDEEEMNAIGYELLGEDKVEAAAQVFKLNKDAFPESSNVYDSYAEALMALGKNDAAIKNYRISVEKDPSNQHGIDMLKKLGVDTSELEQEVAVLSDTLDYFVGKYEMSPEFAITISRSGSQMKAQATGQSQLNIYHKSGDTYYLKAVDAQLVFNRDNKGKIESLTLIQNGREQIAKRIPEE